MNFLITGGTGFIGSELRAMLLKEGHDLVIVTRDPSRKGGLQSDNQRFISWQDDLPGEMSQSDVVINLAGETLFGKRWTRSVKDSILRSRIEATRTLVDAMGRSDKPPGLLISGSAVGYYGDRQADRLTEVEPAGDDFLAHVCSRWEEEALRAEPLGVRVVNPRIGIALQTGGGVLQKMRLPFLLFAGGPLGSGAQYMPWIHMSDLCRALVYPVERTEIAGPYNVCSPNPVTMQELADTLGRVMNRPSLIRVPEWLLNGVLGEAAGPVLSSLYAVPDKLTGSGFTFEFEDLEEALADLI